MLVFAVCVCVGVVGVVGVGVGVFAVMAAISDGVAVTGTVRAGQGCSNVIHMWRRSLFLRVVYTIPGRGLDQQPSSPPLPPFPAPSFPS